MKLIDEWVGFSEKHPAEGWSGGDLSALRLGRFAVAVSEALLGLRREHFDPPLLPGHCTCGADAHNAILDRFAAMLDAEET